VFGVVPLQVFDVMKIETIAQILAFMAGVAALVQMFFTLAARV